jgi:hypothetical protein
MSLNDPNVDNVRVINDEISPDSQYDAASSSVHSTSANSSTRKRRFGPSISPYNESTNARKAQKVSRACDYCKGKKNKCNGLRPCDACVKKGLKCTYNAKYSRGRPPTPPPGEVRAVVGIVEQNDMHGTTAEQQVAPMNALQIDRNPSRGSPELDMAEIEGQYFEPTSGLTFLHRAWKRLSSQRARTVPDLLNGDEKSQPLMAAGDRSFDDASQGPVSLPDRSAALNLLNFYFEVCVVTYRFFHRPTVLSWFDVVQTNFELDRSLHQGLGHAKCAIVLGLLAIATRRQQRTSENVLSEDQEHISLKRSDQFFCAAMRLTDAEIGLPRLESAQARLVQVLYLLQTSRMNQGWYVFGNTLQIISALGLHRRAGRIKNATPAYKANFDYIHSQNKKRTFWVAYTIDKYLAVVLGRPRHYHDDDIDQDFPDSVNDEDMSSSGPLKANPDSETDCHVDALIFHAKLSQIIGAISHSVYSIKKMPKHERLAAAHTHGQSLHEWKASLPPHLGIIRPSSLIPSFRRQAIALRLAYAHAVIHANRPFLLGGMRNNSINANSNAADAAGGSMQGSIDAVSECIEAAQAALQTVDMMSSDGTLFYAFWWTHYVTFCALAVIYVWEIQQHQNANGTRTPIDTAKSDNEKSKLLDLAERCHNHLAMMAARDSPSRRYSVILEELRLEARQRSNPNIAGVHQLPGFGTLSQDYHDNESANNGVIINSVGVSGVMSAEHPRGYSSHNMTGQTQHSGDDYNMNNFLSDWQTTDWLELDSSVGVQQGVNCAVIILIIPLGFWTVLRC